MHSMLKRIKTHYFCVIFYKVCHFLGNGFNNSLRTHGKEIFAFQQSRKSLKFFNVTYPDPTFLFLTRDPDPDTQLSIKLDPDPP
jgi:hypothetical protein